MRGSDRMARFVRRVAHALAAHYLLPQHDVLCQEPRRKGLRVRLFVGECMQGEWLLVGRQRRQRLSVPLHKGTLFDLQAWLADLPGEGMSARAFNVRESSMRYLR